MEEEEEGCLGKLMVTKRSTISRDCLENKEGGRGGREGDKDGGMKGRRDQKRVEDWGEGGKERRGSGEREKEGRR